MLGDDYISEMIIGVDILLIISGLLGMIIRDD